MGNWRRWRCGGVAKLGCLRCYWAIGDVMKVRGGILMEPCRLWYKFSVNSILRIPLSPRQSSPIQTPDEFHFQRTFCFQNMNTEIDSTLTNVDSIEPRIEGDSRAFACDSIAKQKLIPLLCVLLRCLMDVKTCWYGCKNTTSLAARENIRNIKASRTV